MAKRWDNVLLLGTFAACLALMAWTPISDPDVGFHIAAGRQIVSQRTIPTTECFSFARAGEPVGANPWLGSVLVYLLYVLGGATALTAAKIAIVLGIFSLLLGFSRRAASHYDDIGPHHLPVAVLFLTLGAWAARMRFSERPLLVSALLEAFLLWRLSRLGSRPGLRDLWWLPPLFLFWWNLHGGYVYGLLIIAAFVVGDLLERGRRPAALRLLAATALSMLLAIVVTFTFYPTSVRGLTFPLRMFQSPVFSRVIEELHRPSLGKHPAFAALLVLTPACLAWSWIRGRRPRAAHIFLAAGFALLALSRTRMILEFALVAAPLAAAYAPSVPPRLPSRHTALAAAGILAAIVPWRVIVGENPRLGHGFDPATYPLRTFEVLRREGIQGEVMVNDLWSGPFLWQMHPARRVFVHNQFELYQEALWRDEYLPLLGAAPGWQATLDRYGINALLLRYSGAGYLQEIGAAIFEEPGWTLAYWDDTAMIYVRNIPEHAALIAREGRRLLNPERPRLEDLATRGLGADVERELQSVLARTPDCRRAWSLLGELRLGMGNPRGAEEAFRSLYDVVTRRGEKAAALAGLGLVFLQQGDFAQARETFSRALGFAPGDPFLLTRRALASLAAGDRAAAVADARRLMKSRSSRPEDLRSLADSFAAAGDAGTARELAEKAQSLAANR